MKQSRWYLWLALLLTAVSASFYALQIALFHKPGDTYFYLLQDLAFVPMQVLLVTLFLNDLMARREKRQLLRKMNMVIGAFFSEMGSDLIAQLSRFDAGFAALRPAAAVDAAWKDADFVRAGRAVAGLRHEIDTRRADLGPLRDFLLARRGFLLGLLENQNLLEHQSFTDLLWAVTHLSEELQFRTSLDGLPDSDHQHLSGDIRRVYTQLLVEWLAYADHLRRDYPYMYSLVVRRNPFIAAGDAAVR
jgi:hypothetical protein